MKTVHIYMYSITLLLLAACERRELTYYTEAELTISVDWSKAALSEEEEKYGATALFYPEGENEPIVVLMGDRNGKTVRLKEGLYNIVLFNRSFDDFSNIAFRGKDCYRKLEAYTKDIGTKADESSSRVATESPDELAADFMGSLEVTADMLGNYSPTRSGVAGSAVSDSIFRLSLTPGKRTKDITVSIRIEGMNNIRTAFCRLSGVSESIFLASGESSEQTITQQFSLANPIYLPDSKTEGTMSASFSVFGFDEKITHELHLEALLIDGKTVYKEDFPNVKVTQTDSGNGSLRITIDQICQTPVPDVKPEGGSGMDADVGDWDNEENSDIDI